MDAINVVELNLLWKATVVYLNILKTVQCSNID